MSDYRWSLLDALRGGVGCLALLLVVVVVFYLAVRFFPLVLAVFVLVAVFGAITNRNTGGGKHGPQGYGDGPGWIG